MGFTRTYPKMVTEWFIKPNEARTSRSSDELQIQKEVLPPFFPSLPFPSLSSHFFSLPPPTHSLSPLLSLFLFPLLCLCLSLSISPSSLSLLFCLILSLFLFLLFYRSSCLRISHLTQWLKTSEPQKFCRVTMVIPSLTF